MGLTAAEFLAIVERDYQIPQSVVDTLRRQISSTARPIEAVSVAKHLVDRGHLQAAVARQILSAAQPQSRSAPATSLTDFVQTPAPTHHNRPTAAEVSAHLLPPEQRAAGNSTPDAPRQVAPQEEEELGLAPDEDDPPPPKLVSPIKAAPANPAASNQLTTVKAVSQPQPLTEEDLGLAPDDDDDGAPPRKPSPGSTHQSAAKPAAANVRGATAQPAATGSRSLPQGRPVVAVQPVSLEEELGLLPDDDAVATSGLSKAVPGKGTPAGKLPPVKVTPVGVNPVTGVPVKAASAARPSGKPHTAVKSVSAAGPKTKLPNLEALEFLDDPLLSFQDNRGGNLADATGRGPADMLASSAAVQQTILTRPNAGQRSLGRQLIVGSATVVVVLCFLGIAISHFSKSDGSAEFELAERDYQAQANQAAVDKFNDYLRYFPDQDRAGIARVHLGMARLRLATDSHRRSAALPAVAKILDELAGERDFSQLHGELAALLTNLAQQLTEDAGRSATAQETGDRVALARRALQLVSEPRYVPLAVRDTERLQQFEDRLSLIDYRLDRSPALEKSLFAMKKALAAHDLAAAYAARRQIVGRYPELARWPGLLEMGGNLAAEAARQVTVSRESRPALNEDVPPAVLATLLLTSAAVKAPRVEQLLPCFAHAQGALYALDAGSGRVLWRRYRGDSDLFPVVNGDTTDVLLVDARDHSLLSVDARSGKLRWRQILGQPLIGPTLAGKQAFVATRDGWLLSLDATSGESTVQARLPQSLGTSLASDPGGNAVYALAEHSNLYTLGAGDLACRKVTYVGHETGTIDVPPLVLPKHLLIAENRGLANSVLRILARDGEGNVGPVVQDIALAGQVASPPVSDGSCVAVATVGGPTYVFDLVERGDLPLKKRAELPPAPSGTVTGYVLIEAGQLWVADAGLRRYSLAALGRRTEPAWQCFVADVTQQPLQARKNLLISARRTTGTTGLVVSGAAADGGTPAWETRLAAPPLVPARPENDAAPLVAACPDGSVYLIDVAAARDIVRCQPAIAARAPESSFRPDGVDGIRACLPAGGQQALIAWGNAASYTVVDLAARTAQSLPLPGLPLCAPVSTPQGVFGVCQPGEVCLLGPATGRPGIGSFLPVVRPADAAKWYLVSPGDTNGATAVVAARGAQLFALGVQPAPIPHLVPLGTVELPAALAGAPAATEMLLSIVDREGQLQAYSLPELRPAFASNLGSRAAWGPRAVGSMILVATEDGQLHCFDQEKHERWNIKLAHAPLVGACLSGEQLIVASRDGAITRCDLTTGEQAGAASVGEPLRDGPIMAGGALIVVSTEGSLLKVAVP